MRRGRVKSVLPGVATRILEVESVAVTVAIVLVPELSLKVLHNRRAHPRPFFCIHGLETFPVERLWSAVAERSGDTAIA